MSDLIEKKGQSNFAWGGARVKKKRERKRKPVEFDFFFFWFSPKEKKADRQRLSGARASSRLLLSFLFPSIFQNHRHPVQNAFAAKAAYSRHRKPSTWRLHRRNAKGAGDTGRERVQKTTHRMRRGSTSVEAGAKRRRRRPTATTISTSPTPTPTASGERGRRRQRVRPSSSPQRP